MCLYIVHEEHSDLVEKSPTFLEAHFGAHLALMAESQALIYAPDSKPDGP